MYFYSHPSLHHLLFLPVLSSFSFFLLLISFYFNLLPYHPLLLSPSCFHPHLHISHSLLQVDGVSLQGCSEQRAMEVLRRTCPLVRLRLMRKAVRLSHILPPIPPLQPLRHSHSFHEGNPYRVGLNKIQETGAERAEYIGSVSGIIRIGFEVRK